MKENKLYTIITENDRETPSVRAEPSKYFLNLEPDKAIAELNAYIRSLEDDLRQYANVDLKVPENLQKSREVSFELEIAHYFLRRFKKEHGSSD